ncbi:unnamed protein product [Orchesella dallaii]|uniref:RNA helicase n=1 Tax=Orchesella dallaii TaxID=48710 RepID=A0ABP1Q8M9_9HEXA
MDNPKVCNGVNGVATEKDEEAMKDMLESLSFKVLEESVDDIQNDGHGGTNGGLQDKTESNGDGAEYQPEVYPLGHDRSKKLRSLDVQITGEEATVKFEDLCLKEPIVRGLKHCRFFEPSPIQLKAIPIGKCGYDLIMQAKSGTGKTCVFSVIILEQLDLMDTESIEKIQALVLAPTREIAVQNEMVLKHIGVFMPSLKVKSFIGGTAVSQSVSRSRNCNVVVGTPGRILHMIVEGHMDLSQVEVVVIDEADRIMEASFISDVSSIFQQLPEEKQIIAASATYPDGLKGFVRRFMREPIEITIDSTPMLLAVEQYIVNVHKVLSQPESKTNEDVFQKKFKVILEIIQKFQYTQAIIFTRYTLQADKVYNLLTGLNYDAALLHGKISQFNRLAAFRNTKDGKCKILVASDVAARGIDCEGVDLVINFEAPDNLCTYIHRTGRAGRFGSAGIVITLWAFREDVSRIRDFINKVKCEVHILDTPQHLEMLAEGRAEKLRHIYTNVEEVDWQNKDNDRWKEMLDTLMNDEDNFSYPSLERDTFMGLRVNVDRTKIENFLKEMKDEMEK